MDVIGSCKPVSVSSSRQKGWSRDMVNPITGPFSVNRSMPYFREEKIWSRQKKPYNIALPYSHRRGYTYTVPVREDAWRWFAFVGTEYSGQNASAYSRAYGRLLDKLGEAASLGLNLAQYGQARDMINKRGSQLLAFGTALAKRSPIGVAAALGISAKRARDIMRGRHGVSRSLADLWLEFWFGWKPAVSDIYSACEVFDNELQWERIRVRSGKVATPMTVKQPVKYAYSEGIKWRGETTCLIGLDARVTNPNLRLMESFGLLNLAAIGVDAVPWSFVVGWFSNLNQYLASLTALAGIETSNAFVTYSTKIWGETWWSSYHPSVIDSSRGGQGHGTLVWRKTLESIPRPRLLFEGKRFQPTRGATAISLLVQKLPKK